MSNERIGRRVVSHEEYLQYTRDRLLAKSRRDEQSGCLIWTGTVTKNGYGQIGFKGKISYTHRIAYLVWCGELGDLHVDHVRARGCISRACIEPSHLEAVTQQENNRRLQSDHCKRGLHPLSGDNLYVQPSTGGRRCRACEATQEEIRMGNIGKRVREVEFEPIEFPAVPEPAPAPAPATPEPARAPEPQKVPVPA